MKEIYHCSPSELSNQSEEELQLHFDFFMQEKEHEWLESKRNNPTSY